jgi:hypothetical protein
MLPAAPVPIRIDDGWVSASYGVKTPTKVLVLEVTGALPLSFDYVFSDTRLDGTGRSRAMSALAEAGARS